VYLAISILNLGSQALRIFYSAVRITHNLSQVVYNLHARLRKHISDEEFAVAYFADVTSIKLSTAWENTRLEEALGAISMRAKLAVLRILGALVLLFAAITEWILDGV
jgi:hypothetical protein